MKTGATLGFTFLLLLIFSGCRLPTYPGSSHYEWRGYQVEFHEYEYTRKSGSFTTLEMTLDQESRAKDEPLYIAGEWEDNEMSGVTIIDRDGENCSTAVIRHGEPDWQTCPGKLRPKRQPTGEEFREAASYLSKAMFALPPNP
jgi:hypothetical protein